MCLVCERIELTKRGQNPFFVRELETGYVVIGDHQHFHGYTVFICKEHKSELFDLTPEFQAKFLEEMALVGHAVAKAFAAEKINYELLGNGDAHMHWHLFPRRAGDLEGYGTNGLGPVWKYPTEKMYADSNRPSEEELTVMKEKLGKALEELLE